MKTLTGYTLLLYPLIFIALMWSEGGMMAIALYVMYMVAVASSVIVPWVGFKLIWGQFPNGNR